jgi:hypothetical protein
MNTKINQGWRCSWKADTDNIQLYREASSRAPNKNLKQKKQKMKLGGIERQRKRGGLRIK